MRCMHIGPVWPVLNRFLLDKVALVAKTTKKVMTGCTPIHNWICLLKSKEVAG